MRTEIAIISALTLVLSMPLAFGEIVETKGQNYDLVENFFIGEATWTSHPERIMDGGWQNYALSNTGDKVIFNTNAVGSFVFDKNSCSYSIYGNGFDGEQIIPSVSAVATYLNNGQWQNLPINDEACTVTVDRYEDGVFLTSTKVITEDITEDVFISYTGTTENFYVNATNTNFDLIQSSNGTNIGYFNGETRVLESVEVEKFVQEIRLDINSGFKETFKVWHDGDEQLGISQTVHTGESITIGDQTINIAELNGQSFDRQFIIDNEAEILAITDSINYDFDTGIDSLSNVNIIFDGDYKVNMDYADGDFVGYLEIDPTFTGVVVSNRYIEDSNNNNVCDPSGTYIDQTNSSYMTRLRSTPQSEDCAYTGFEFDISSITDGSTVTDSKFKFEINSVSNPRSCDFIGMDIRPSTATADQVFRSIHENGMTGTELVASDSVCTTTGTNKVVDLGSAGNTYFTNQLVSDDWAGIGVRYDNMALDSNVRYTGQNNAGTPVPTLELTYTVPIAPQPPTGLTTVTGVPVELDWTAPTDNGGSAITGYKVFRTLNEYVYSELPDNSANSAGIDFTNNEFLTHGFETGSVTPTYTADLSTSSWTTAGTGTQVTIDTTNEEIDFSMNTNNGHFTTGYYDLTAVSDTNWIIRSQLDIDTVTQGSAVNDIFFGYGIGSINNSIKDSQDFLGLMIRIDDTKTDIFAVETDGSAPNNETTTLFTRQAQAETLYVELKRDSATSFTVNLYSDSGYSTLLESQTITVPSTVSGLQYIKVAGVQGFSDSELIGSVSNIKFYNDMTTTTEDIIPDKSTNSIAITGSSFYLGGNTPTTENDIGVNEQVMSSANFEFIGEKIQSTSSALHGVETNKMGLMMKMREGSPTGIATVGVMDSSANFLYQFGTIDVSTLPTTYTWIYFENPQETYTLSSGERIGIKYTGGDVNNRIGVYWDNNGNYDGGNSDGSEESGGAWNDRAGQDLRFKIFPATISTAIQSTSTTGVIGTGIQNPDLSFTDSNLPDNTDDFSVGSWVKLDKQTAILTASDPDEDGYLRDATTDGDCADYTAGGDGDTNLRARSLATTYDCEVGYIEWNTSSIPDNAIITNVELLLDVEQTNLSGTGVSCEINPLTLQPTAGYSNALLVDLQDGTPYIDGDSQCLSVTDGINFDLGTNADTDLQNLLSNDWFGVGLWLDISNVGGNYFLAYKAEQVATNPPTLTVTYEAPPTNIKLLGLNDVTFNVGTTSASVVELATAPSYSTNFGTSTGWTVTDSEISIDTSNNRIYYNGDLDTTDTSAYYDYYTSQGANLQTWTVDIDITKISNNNLSHRTEFLITDTLGGVGVAQNAIGITTGANNSMLCRVYDGTTTPTDIGTHSASNGVTKYVRLSYDGTTFTCDLMDSSRTSVSSSHSQAISGVDMSNARYIIISDRDNANSSVNNVVVEYENLAVTPTNTMESSIISATGLADNTSTPQHYTFTRSANDWEIYQNGAQVGSTVTDTTSLGAGGVVQLSDTNDFSTDNMVDSDSSRIGISNGVFSAQLQRDGSNDASTYTLSNTYGNEFNMKYEFQTNGLNGSPSGTFGLYSEDNTSGSTTTHDSFVALNFNDLVLVRLQAGDNTAPYGGTGTSGSSWITLTANTNYFVEIVGNGDDTFTLNIRTGSHTGTLFATQTVTQTGIDNLSYWGAKNTMSSGTSGTIVTLDNLSITGQGATSYHTVHIDGMIDEYFINSDALTATEVDMAYDKGSEPTQIATTGTTPSYDDSSVTGGTEYYYTVKATNAVGDSDFLTPLVSALAGTPPDVPTSVSSTINSPNTAPLDITVSWSAPTNVGTGTLTGFEIYRDSTLITTTGLVTSYTDTVPSGGGTFEYKLKAVSTHGTSGFSSTTSTTTPTVPPAPTNAPALAINNPNPSPLDIEVSWTEPASGGSIIQSYEIFRSADDVTYTSVGTVTDLDFTDTVPSAGTWYYKFTSINLVGSSGLSPSNSITTASVPSSPLNASSVIPSINSAPYDVTVSWDLPTSTGGSALTGYNVYRQTGTGAFSLITTTTALGYVDTVPTALNQDYTFKIHAVNNVGESTGFTTTTITTGDVPDAPTLSFTTGTTALSWTVPNSDASITGYEIFRDGSSLTTVTTTSHSDFTPINFGQSYQYEVQAVSSLGNSASSNSIVTTPETEITGMIVQGITGTGAVIDWNEPAYYQGQITSYNVYYSTPAQSANPTISAGTTTNTYSNFAPTLEYDTSYTFGVTINSPLGNSGFSNLVNATTGVDNSIVAYDPNTGDINWFDIDSVSEQTVNVIEFQRETQNLNVNGTFTDVDTLQVGYPSWWDDMTCDIDYKFAQKTEQYVEGIDMTAVVNSADANQQVIGFQFHDIDNEVIEVECAPQVSQHDDEVSAKYIMTQTNLSTGVPNIPLVTQIQAFQTGDYGTDGEFGALDIVGLFVILISMVGFNRLNPIVGVLLSASLVFGLSFFGIISLPTVLVGVVALVIFLAWGITRNR